MIFLLKECDALILFQWRTNTNGSCLGWSLVVGFGIQFNPILITRTCHVSLSQRTSWYLIFTFKHNFQHIQKHFLFWVCKILHKTLKITRFLIKTYKVFFWFLGTAAIRAAKISEAHDNGTAEKVSSAEFGLTLKDLPKSIWYG